MGRGWGYGENDSNHGTWFFFIFSFGVTHTLRIPRIEEAGKLPSIASQKSPTLHSNLTTSALIYKPKSLGAD